MLKLTPRSLLAFAAFTPFFVANCADSSGELAPVDVPQAAEPATETPSHPGDDVIRRDDSAAASPDVGDGSGDRHAPESYVEDGSGDAAGEIAWLAPEPIPGAPLAPILAMAMATPTVDGAMVWWLPATDDSTPHDALTYEIHVGFSAEFQPSDRTLRSTWEGAESGLVAGLVAGTTIWLTVAAVDADGQRGTWDEPIELKIPAEPLRFDPDTRVVELAEVAGVVVSDDRVTFPAANLAVPIEQGDVIALSLEQIVENERSLARVLTTRVVDGERIVMTEPLLPQQLIISGSFQPVVRFFSIPDELAPAWEDDAEEGWQRREMLVADGAIHVVDRRRAPARVQKACVGNWWDCIATAVGPSRTCAVTDLGTAIFSSTGGSGITRFGFGCRFDSGVTASTGCDLDSSSAVVTFDAFGQSDNGRRCVAGEAHVALQGEFGIGGEAVFLYDGDTTRRDIGAGDDCNYRGSNPALPPCEGDGDRALAGEGESERTLGAGRSEVTLKPRVLGGVDISVRADGAAGVGVEYEFFNRYKTIRAGWFIWISLGIRAVGEASIEASGTMEAGLKSDFGNNVGLDVNVVYDGSRSGDAGDPYLFSRSSPNSSGPSIKLRLNPSFQPRLSGSARARAIGTLAVYVYALLESTVYFEVGPKAKLQADLGVGAPSNDLTFACPGPPRINRFDVDFSLGPAMTFEIQWPFTGNPINVFGRTASWYWDVGSFPSLTFVRRLLELPRWNVLRAEPRDPWANITDICPGKRGQICINVWRPDQPFRVDWDTVNWVAPAFVSVRGRTTGVQCLDVYAPIPSSGQQGLMRVSLQPEFLGPLAEMCGEYFFDIGTRDDGCRWIGDGFCDHPQEECGTADCPFGSNPCYCGDGICDNTRGDNCGTCPADCGVCTPPITVQPTNFVRIVTSDPLHIRWNSILNSGVRTVNLTPDFYMADAETSQQQWFDVMNPIYATLGHPNYSSFAACRADCTPYRNPCPYACPSGADLPGTANPCPDCPVSDVNFREVLRFMNALSALEGIPECYRIDVDTVQNIFVPQTVNAPNGNVTQCVGYRLPTEAEWEYAYRYRPTQPVGSRLRYTDFHNGQNVRSSALDLSSIAWYRDSFPLSNSQAMPRRGLIPTDAGLYDMSGNVWEFTWTDLNEDAPSAIAALDPGATSRATSEYERIIRGGSYVTPPAWCAGGSDNNGGVHYIYSTNRDSWSWNVGFRTVRTVW